MLVLKDSSYLLFCQLSFAIYSAVSGNFRCFTLFRVIIAVIEEDSTITWIYRNGYQDNSNSQIYVASMYFTITTITTVGFGDIVGYT